MKGYVFNKYSDRGGIGEYEVFNTPEEAIAKAKAEWEALHEKDKKRYRNDVADFGAYICEMEDVGDGDYLPDFGSCDVLWDALEEHFFVVDNEGNVYGEADSYPEAEDVLAAHLEKLTEEEAEDLELEIIEG